MSTNKNINLVRKEKYDIEVLPPATYDVPPRSETGGPLETFLRNRRIGRDTNTLALEVRRAAQETALLDQKLGQIQKVNEIIDARYITRELLWKHEHFEEKMRREADEREEERDRQRAQSERKDVIDGLEFQLAIDQIEEKRRQVALRTAQAQKQLDDLQKIRAKTVEDELVQLAARLRGKVREQVEKSKAVETYIVELRAAFNDLKLKFPDQADLIEQNLRRQIMRVQQNGIGE